MWMDFEGIVLSEISQSKKKKKILYDLIHMWNLKTKHKDFPGGPVVKISHFHCKGHKFSPWLGNKNAACCVAQPKKAKEKHQKANS